MESLKDTGDSSWERFIQYLKNNMTESDIKLLLEGEELLSNIKQNKELYLTHRKGVRKDMILENTKKWIEAINNNMLNYDVDDDYANSVTLHCPLLPQLDKELYPIQLDICIDYHKEQITQIFDDGRLMAYLEDHYNPEEKACRNSELKELINEVFTAYGIKECFRSDTEEIVVNVAYSIKDDEAEAYNRLMQTREIYNLVSAMQHVCMAAKMKYGESEDEMSV